MKPINTKLVRLAKLFSPLWYLLKPFTRHKPTEAAPKTILIFDFHLIGDIVMLTPMLQSLKAAYPHARLVLVAGPWANELLYGTNIVDAIIPFSAPWVKYGQGIRGLISCIDLLKELRNQSWDLGIEVRGDIRQIFLLWLTGAKRRVGFNFTGGSPLLTDVVFDNGKLAHITDHHKRICEHIGIWSKNLKYQPFLKLTSNENIALATIPKFIGFHFGASLPLRRLPISEMTELLSKFECSKAKLIVFTTPDNHEFDAVFVKLPEKLRSKIEFWSGGLREFIAMLSRATHLYCMDSGPAHIASALGVPVTVFFGPAVSTYVRPIGEDVEVISKAEVQCRPCNQVECTNKVNQYCMIGLAKRIKPFD